MLFMEKLVYTIKEVSDLEGKKPPVIRELARYFNIGRHIGRKYQFTKRELETLHKALNG